jgi:hypothetical protein
MESDRGQEFQTNDLPGSSLPDAVQLMAHLLRLGETLSQHPHRVGERLNQEVMRITQGRAWLLLADQPIPAEPDAPAPAYLELPLAFYQRSYGTLCLAADASDPARPALPLSTAQLLASVCSLLLYMLELSTLAQRLTSQEQGDV